MKVKRQTIWLDKTGLELDIMSHNSGRYISVGLRTNGKLYINHYGKRMNIENVYKLMDKKKRKHEKSPEDKNRTRLRKQ